MWGVLSLSFCDTLGLGLWLCLSVTGSVVCLSVLYAHIRGHTYIPFKAGPRRIIDIERSEQGQAHGCLALSQGAEDQALHSLPLFSEGIHGSHTSFTDDE